MSKASEVDQNGSQPPKGDGIPDGVVQPIKPAGAARAEPNPKNKDIELDDNASNSSRP